MPAFQWIVLAAAAACGGHSVGAQAAPSRVVVPEAEAIERYALRDRLDTYHRLAGARAPEAGIVVVVVEGDWHVRGDLLLDWASDRASLDPPGGKKPGDASAVTEPGAIGLVVMGNLRADGAILNTNLNGGPFLLVLGRTDARALYSAGAELRFDGPARFTDAVIGVYNDGYTHFAGDAFAPVVVSDDHAFDFRGKAPPYFDPFDVDDDEVQSWGTFLRADLAAKVDPDVDEVFDVAAGLLPAIRRGEAIVDPAYAARARGVVEAAPITPVSGGAPR